MRTTIIAFVLSGATAVAVHAQPAESRGFVGGGVTLAVQPQEETDGHYLVQSTVGGESIGGHLSAGVFIQPRVSVGAEVSFPRSVAGRRVELAGGGRFDHLMVRHRETIVNILFRFHHRRGGWEIAPAGGIGWVRTRTSSEGESRSIGDGIPPILLGPVTETDTRAAVTGGVDVARRVGGPVRVAPFFRLHWVSRPESPQQTFARLPAIVYRAGIQAVAVW